MRLKISTILKLRNILKWRYYAFVNFARTLYSCSSANLTRIEESTYWISYCGHTGKPTEIKHDRMFKCNESAINSSLTDWKWKTKCMKITPFRTE